MTDQWMIPSYVEMQVGEGALPRAHAVICSVCSSRLEPGKRCDHVWFYLEYGRAWVYQSSGGSLKIGIERARRALRGEDRA